MGLINRGSTSIDFLTGEKNLNYAGGFYNANSPVRVAPENQDPLKWRLEQDGYGFAGNNRGPEAMKLRPDEEQQINAIMFEMGVRKALEDVVTTPTYKKMADSWDRRPFDPDEPGSQPPHIKMIQATVNKYRRAAMNKYANDDEGFAMRAQEHIADRKRLNRAEFSKLGEGLK